MVVFPYAFHQHVVYINLHIPPNLVGKHLVHQSLIRRPCVFESEWHYFVAEKSPTRNKGSFFLIRFLHSDLIVTRKSIHKAQKLMSYGRVYQGIYPWEWVTIFWAGSVEIHEINAHPPFSIGLFNHNHVCQPVGVIHLPNKICIKQLLNFFIYSFVSFLSEYSFSLPDGK